MSDRAPDADVIVVGAGPGGSTTALALADAGLRVVLLEAGAFPRDKVCGDVLLPELEGHLAALGLSLDTLAHDARHLIGCDYTSPAGRRVVGEFCDEQGTVHPWRILPRKVFDHRLASAAADRGAELREHHRLTDLRWDPERRLNVLEVRVGRGSERRDVTLVAPLVVGADGAGSRVAHARGLRPDPRGDAPGNTAVALRGYLPWSENADHLQIVTHRRVLPGCTWIVPNGRGEANVGIVVVASDRRRLELNLHRELAGLLGSRIELADVRKFSGWKLPGGHLARSAVSDGLLLVGDAAGFIDPFTGHGIQNAMASGRLAATAAIEALESGDLGADGAALAGYQEAWRRAFRDEYRLGSLLQRVHRSPRLMEMAIARAGHSRRWADRFMGLVGHAIPRHHALGARFLLDLVRPTGRWRS